MKFGPKTDTADKTALRAAVETAVLLGDADKNSSINSTDARLILQHAVGKIAQF